MTSDSAEKVSLERRAEELIDAPKFKFEPTQGPEGARQIEWIASARKVIEQLLSENRQGEHAHIYTNYQGYVDELKSTIASLRQDLDRIEKALRDAVEAADAGSGTVSLKELRRILALTPKEGE